MTITDRLWDTERFKMIANHVGTPLFIYVAEDIRIRAQQLRSVFPKHIQFLYSLKANPSKALVNVLCTEGFGCEVSSRLELEIALAAGATPQSILFVGPAKSDDELCRCIEVGIKGIAVESLSEISRINILAQNRGVSQPIALRLNPDLRGRRAKLSMSGNATQFGIDETQLPSAMHLIMGSNNIKLLGLHVYMGTRILDVSAILNNTSQALDLASHIMETYNVPLEFLDVGGGFGVNYFDGEQELDILELGAAISSTVTNFVDRFPDTKIIFELGRFMVARSGIFITTVRNIKYSKGRMFAICDGGSNCNSTAAGIGSIFRRNFPIVLLGVQRDGDVKYTLTGPLCTPTDVIGENVELGRLEEGDLIAILFSGAYGPSASPVHFLGFGYPAEVMIDGHLVQLVRQRDTLDDAINKHVNVSLSLPEW